MTICHYCYILGTGFKFQSNLCSQCHDVLMKSMNLNDIAIPNIHDAGYSFIIIGISKIEAKSLMQNVNLSGKVEHYINYKNYKKCLKHM